MYIITSSHASFLLQAANVESLDIITTFRSFTNSVKYKISLSVNADERFVCAITRINNPNVRAYCFLPPTSNMFSSNRHQYSDDKGRGFGSEE